MTRPRLDFPWTLALAVAALAATLLAIAAPGPTTSRLIADAAAIRDGQLWRLLTGPLVHATWGHLARDLAVCLIIGAGYEPTLRPIWPALGVAALILPTAAVTLTGDWSAYFGLSGLSHAWIAAALVHEHHSTRPLLRRTRYRACLHAASLAFAAKLVYEAITATPLFPMDLGPTIRQVPLAHLTGAVIGATLTCAYQVTSRRWPGVTSTARDSSREPSVAMSRMDSSEAP